MKTQIKKLHERARLPTYGTPGSAGADLRVVLDDELYNKGHSLVLKPNEVKLVSTGLSIYLSDPHYVGYIFPRSGLGHKKGLVLGNLTGVIDSDYQGPLMISLWNRSTENILICDGDAVAQYVIMPVIQTTFEQVSDFENETERGSGGFGHTGK